MRAYEAVALPTTAVLLVVTAITAPVLDCLLGFARISVMPEDFLDGGCPEMQWAWNGDTGGAFARPPTSVDQIDVHLDGDVHYIAPRTQVQSVLLTSSVLALALAIATLTRELARRRRRGDGPAAADGPVPPPPAA